jgi:hypothetical protein
VYCTEYGENAGNTAHIQFAYVVGKVCVCGGGGQNQSWTKVRQKMHNFLPFGDTTTI